MIALNVLENLVIRNGIPLYIEHNDFLNGGITVDEEVEELLNDSHIDQHTADKMVHHNSVWSIRYYYDKHSFEIFYDDTLNGVIAKLLHKLGK